MKNNFKGYLFLLSTVLLVSCGDNSKRIEDKSVSDYKIIPIEKTNTKTKITLLLNSPLIYKKPEHTTTSNAGQMLLHQINETNSSIDFAIYGIRHQDSIINALENAKKRGVIIRGIVDKDINDENYYTSTTKLISRITNIKTDYQVDKETLAMKSNESFNYKPYCDRPESYKGPVQCIGYSLNNYECIISAHASKEELEFKGDIMHNKFFIFDKKTVWTGSTNLSDSGTGGYNANASILIEDPEIAMVFRREFEDMYIHNNFHRRKRILYKKHYTKNNIDIAFSPQSYTVETIIRPLIKNSNDYIDLPIFFLTHKKIAGDLISAHKRGVKVRVILDATAATNGYSKHEILRAAGIPVKVENWGGKMHMKVAVIDGKHLVAGSMNWTSAGERSNDENTVIIHDTYFANEMHSFFNKLWTSIDNRWLNSQPNPEGLTSHDACFDGVDNNFNHIIDKDEPSCIDEKEFNFKTLPYNIVKKREGNNLIKGNINKKGQKVYVSPSSKYYDKTKINSNYNERWFCSIYDARENGWKSYYNYNKKD